MIRKSETTKLFVNEDTLKDARKRLIYGEENKAFRDEIKRLAKK